MRRAAILALGLASATGVVAVFWPQPKVRSPVEAYLRQGPSRGAEALARDVLNQTGLGGDPGPALQRLVSMGFTCDLAGEQTGEWTCLFRRSSDRRSVLSVEARIQVERGATTGTSGRIWESATR